MTTFVDTVLELNERRIRTYHVLQSIEAMNMPTDAAERVKSDARYALVKDAWMRAEGEYRRALSGLSTDELLALVNR